MWNWTARCRAVAAAAAVWGLSQGASAADLLGVDFGGVVYDVSTVTGNASNPRATGLSSVMGVTRAPDDTYYVVTAFTASPANTLYELDPDNGNVVAIGPAGVDMNEGDLDVDPISGDIYAIQTTLDNGKGRSLLRLSAANGSAQVLGMITNDASDHTAMAFADDGTLYVLDTNVAGVGPTRLLTVNPANGQILTDTAVSVDLGFLGGMDFDPDTGVLYVADGGNMGTNQLYTLNPQTGQAQLIGPLNLDFGLSGLEFQVCTPAPNNDDCEDAALTFFGPPTPFSNVCATTDGPAHAACDNAGDDQVGSDVWFRRTASCTGFLTVSTCNDANFDTRLAVYKGCACPATEQRLVACNDDAGGCGSTSEVTFFAVIGECYLVRVGGFQGAQGSGQLTFECDPACIWDINGDGIVDVFDLFILLNSWGPCQAPCPADFDMNGVVDVFDLFEMLNNWGNCFPM